MPPACGSPGAGDVRRASRDGLPSLHGVPTSEGGTQAPAELRPTVLFVLPPGLGGIALQESSELLGGLRRRVPSVRVLRCEATRRDLAWVSDLARSSRRVHLLPLTLFSDPAVAEAAEEAVAVARARFPGARITLGRPLGREAAVLEGVLAQMGLVLPLLEPETRKMALLTVGPGRAVTSERELSRITDGLRRAAGFARATCARIESLGSTVLPVAEELLDGFAGPVVVAPLFLFSEARLERLARELSVLRARHSRAELHCAGSMGSHASLLDLLERRLAGLVPASAGDP